ncbi:MAG TPA: lysophospholipid acyltransferase family protein, partial [Alphaproteobacteria bacterium]
MSSPLRALARIAIYLAWTALLIPVQAVAVALNAPLGWRLPRYYHRICCRILGFRIERTGTISTKRPTLFIANHTSYLDITILGALLEAGFVAKAEISGWPLFGLLAKLQRCVFVERRGVRAGEQRDQLRQRLDARHNIVLFPEGTSHDGNWVRPFKTALFAAAEHVVDGAPVTVQPVSVAYTRFDGYPLGRTFRPFYAWYGDMEMMSHIFQALGIGTLTVEVQFHEPVTLAQFASR